MQDLDPQLALAETALRHYPVFAQLEHDGRVRPVRSRSTYARSADTRGFSVHADVVAAKGDAPAIRRITRYCLRPPFAEKQVRATADGRVAFELRRPRSHGATHVVFSELAFVRKLAALVPRPYHHSVRYFGVLASASALRAEVVSSPPIELHLRSEIIADGSSSPARRSSWAILLQKVYGIDALQCPVCLEGRLTILAVIRDPSTLRRI